MAEPNTKPTTVSVETFLKGVSDESKRDDCRALIGIMQKATKSPPVIWGTSIVGFGTYSYKYESGREGDWPIISFAPRKQNLTLYMSGLGESGDLLEKLGKHSGTKWCLYIKRLSDVDVPTLTKIVTQSVTKIKKKYAA